MKKLLVFWLALTASGATLLEQRIDEIIRTAKALAPGAIGVEVIQLRSGKVLYSRNSDKLFTPASNTKLFSTGLALTRLGRDHRMTTRVYVPSGPGVDGQVPGDLVLFGGGDPSMSELVIPYEKGAALLDPMQSMETLADQIVAHGVRTIHGNIVGDDSEWPWDPYPPGWAADDSIWEYGAPVSALTFNCGVFHLSIRPGAAAGDPAMLTLNPPLEFFTISNRIRTVTDGEQKIELDRPLGSRELRLWGTVKTGANEDLAVDDPALFAAAALYDALARRGVSIDGGPVVRHREQGEAPRVPPGRQLVERPSPPLVELLKMVDKVSQNLWAEMMLREVARVRTGDGGRNAGLDELKAFLNEIGVPKEGYVFEDGSGLSRLTLVAPNVITRLLRFMYLSPNGAEWKTLLPIGALDGSLTNRFNKNAAANAIAAKTGSLSHVNALSGYTDSATYGEVAFSILVNHTNARAGEVRSTIDKIALALLE